MLIPIPEASLARFRSAPEPRLASAAREFEAQMMKELLEPLMAGSDGEEGASGALGSFAGEALGRGLSERGGFGIAQKLITQLGASGIAEGAAKTSAPRDAGTRTK